MQKKQTDKLESCGGSCRCPNPTERSVSCCGFVDVPIWPAKVEWVPVDVPIQPAGVACCRCYSGRFCSFCCVIFGPGLPINRINSLLPINIRRTARFWIFRKKKHLSIWLIMFIKPEIRALTTYPNLHPFGKGTHLNCTVQLIPRVKSQKHNTCI